MNRRTEFGWIELLEGILLILLGVISFLRPDGMLTGLIMLYGLVAILTGIADIVFYIKIDSHMGFGPTISLVTGILSVMAGFIFLIYPGAGKILLSILFPLWFIMHCISRLSHLNIVRFMTGRGYYCFTLIVNIVGIILGFVMIFNPYLTLLSAGYLAGLYLVLLGVDSIIAAFSGMSGW